MTTTIRKVLCVSTVFAAAHIYAANYTFPTAGGDLAGGASAWGGTPPSASDTAVINQGGIYTLSENMTLSQLKVDTTAECQFDFTDGNHTIFLGANQYPANQHPLDVYADGRYVRLKGGVWDFGGVEFRGLGQNSQLYFHNGVVVTNVTGFNATYYTASYSSLYLREASKLYCSSFALAGKETIRTRLEVKDGSRILDSGVFYTDLSSTQNGLKSDNRIDILGAGSEISSGSVWFGWITSCNKLYIDNGGAWRTSGNFMFGNGDKNSSSNTITMTGGTLEVSGDFYTRANSCDNVFAATNATISLGSISNLGARTVFDFHNCTFSVGDFYPFIRRGGRVRFSGADSSLTLSRFVWNKGPFWTDVSGANSNSRLEIDDNATLSVALGGNARWMMQSSNCTISVSNGARLMAASGNGLFIGNDESLPYCHDNAIEVRSGGLLETSGDGLRLHSRNNTLLVSNGTVRTSSVMIGYSNSGPAASGCRLTLQGNTPKVEQTGAFWLRNDSVLRFELPASGYADGYVPIAASGFIFNPTARIEVGYEDYLKAGGGDLTLMTFTNVPGDNGGVSFAQWISSQNTAMGLPKNCRLRYLPNDGINPNRLVFHAHKPGGFIISFR